MTNNLNQFADANKASVDTVFGLAGKTFEGVEQLSALNLQVIKTSLAELAEGSEAALSAKSAEELMQLQITALQAAPRKAADYGRQVQEIFTGAVAGQRAATEALVAEVQTKFLDAVNGALKDAPGAENALVLARSAVAAVNNAYDGVNKATKQVSDAVDANVTKFSETAAKSSRSTRTANDA